MTVTLSQKTTTGVLISWLIRNISGVDPEIFERGGPEAIIYKILERRAPESVKMAFECLFQLFYNFFVNIPPKGGGGGWAPPLNLPLYLPSQLVY